MLHDVRDLSPNFFPERYKLPSFLNRKQFINGVNSIKSKILQPVDFFTRRRLNVGDGFILTFDDGLKDHLWVAEYLNERGVAAIFFVPFGILDTKHFVNSNLIQFILASGRLVDVANDLKSALVEYGMSVEDIESFEVSRWAVNVWTKEQVFITRVLREALTPTVRAEVLNSFAKKYITHDFEELHRKFYLSSSDVEAIRDMGHIIGSHGYLSMDLRFESEETVSHEIYESKAALCKYTNGVSMTSYANGGVSDVVLRTARTAGYDFGFGTDHKSIDRTSELLHLPRLDGTKLGIFV